MHFSASTLSEAASGKRLPSLEVTLAYVRACGGDVAEWEKRWRQVAEDPTADTSRTGGVSGNGRPPYVGLVPFGPEDAEWFFGRERITEQLVAQVARQRFVAVAGPSGSGKSSLLAAGLVKAAQTGELGEARTWSVAVLTPGAHPLVAAEQALRECPSDADLLLVVDQFEEVFTLCQDDTERSGFIDALLAAATAPVVDTHVVLGVRSDFYSHCLSHPGLVEAMQQAQFLVGAMTTEQLRQAIVRPAVHAGCTVEGGLVAALVAEAAGQPGTLPLLSHALLETYHRRRGLALTLAAYEEAGGIRRAAARTAEHTYAALTAQQQLITRDLFLRLTALGEGTEDTRRRVDLAELAQDNPDSRTVVDAFVRARLLTADGTSVEIAHEALIRSWPRLHDWLTRDREGLRIHRQLTEATTEWEHHERDEGLLYRRTRLAAWQDRSLNLLNDAERAFLTASRRAAAREHRLRQRRVRLTISGLSSATVIVVVLAVLALMMASRVENARAFAVTRQLVADARAQLQLDPELGLLLAREAYAATANDETEALLRQATADSHIRATLPKSESPVTGVAFSPDGKQLVTTGWDNMVRVWGWDAGRRTQSKLPRVIERRTPRSPVFSPDGSRVAVIDGAPGAVSVWDWIGHGDRSSRGDPVLLGESRSMLNTSVAFSPDGRRLASGGTEGAIEIWNPDGIEPPDALRGHDGSVSDVAFSPDGRHLASCGSDGTVRIWDLVGGGSPIVLRGHEGEVRAVAFSPDGRHVTATGVDGTVRVWDPVGTTDSVVIGSHDSASYAVAYSNDGHLIASTGSDGTVRIWNADQRAAPVVLRGHRGQVTDVAFSPDGKSVASASDDGTAKVWDVDEVEVVTVLRGHKGPVSSIAAASDRRWVASGGQDGTVRIWDTTGDHAATMLQGPDHHPVAQVTFSPDGHHLASADQRGTVFVWDTSDLSKPARRAPIYGKNIAFSEDGTRLAIHNGNFVSIWDTTSTGEPEQLPLPERVVASSDAASQVAWSPDGRHIAAAIQDNVVLLWGLRTLGRPSALPGEPVQSPTLTFDSAGTHLAGGGAIGTINLWDITTKPTQPTVLHGHQGEVWATAFGPDRRLITSGNDGTVRIWKTDGTSQPLTLDGFRAPAHAAVPMLNGQYVTAHDDGTIRIWRCPTCGPITKVLATADQHVTRELTPEERRTYIPANL